MQVPPHQPHHALLHAQYIEEQRRAAQLDAAAAAFAREKEWQAARAKSMERLRRAGAGRRGSDRAGAAGAGRRGAL